MCKFNYCEYLPQQALDVIRTLRVGNDVLFVDIVLIVMLVR